MTEFVFLKPAVPIAADHPLFNAEVEERIAALGLPEKFAWVYRLAIDEDKAPEPVKVQAKGAIADYDVLIRMEMIKAHEALKADLLMMQARKRSFLDIANEHLLG